MYANNRREHSEEGPGGYTGKERRRAAGGVMVYRERVYTHGARAQYENTISQGLSTMGKRMWQAATRLQVDAPLAF